MHIYLHIIKAKTEFTFASSLALSINIETVLERELDMPRVASSRSKKWTLHVIDLSESIIKREKLYF